jgi:hypothetical protein
VRELRGEKTGGGQQREYFHQFHSGKSAARRKKESPVSSGTDSLAGKYDSKLSKAMDQHAVIAAEWQVSSAVRQAGHACILQLYDDLLHEAQTGKIGV